MMQKTETPGRGRRDGGKKPSIDSWFQNIASTSHFPNVLRDMFSEPKNINEAIVRTRLPDVNALNRALQFLAKIERYEMSKRYTDLVMRWLMGLTAIDGVARKEVLQGYVGILAPQLWPGQKATEPPTKKKWGLFRREEEQGKED